MRVAYKTIKFRESTRRIIEQAERIIDDYEAQGLTLTLRQLFYQFVSRGLLPNTERSYKKLGSIINDARLAGLISWTAIEDRTRSLRALAHWGSPDEIIDAAAAQYRIDKWSNQENRVEVWVEKDALIGVVEAVCNKHDVPCFSCRGYVSASEMWSAAQRLKEWEDNGFKTTIIHLGDHDPSGLDMTRDIQDRLELFETDAVVERIALTMDQIRRLRPPPNPAKMTDARFEDYRRDHGDQSWELDALDPIFLSNLIENTVLTFRDEDLWNKAEREERRQKGVLTKIVKDLRKK